MTAQQLKDIEDVAGYFFSPEETAIICELKPNIVDDAEFLKAYKKGRLKKEYELRKSIINLAVNGSSPAQMLVVQMLEKSKLDTIPT